LPHYFEEIAKRKYRLGTIWLPHDASQDRLTGSIDRVVRAAYPNNTVRVIPRMAKKAIGIEAVRGIFPYCYFDEEKCAGRVAGDAPVPVRRGPERAVQQKTRCMMRIRMPPTLLRRWH